MNKRMTILFLLIALPLLAVAGPAALQVAAQGTGERPAGAAPAVSAGDGTLRVATPITATTFYTVTDLGTLDGRSSRAVAINENGQIVGYRQAADLSFRAFLWEEGVMSELSAADEYDSFAHDIDDNGRAVGLLRGPRGVENFHQAVLWQDGSIVYLDTEWSTAAALNHSGQVVGQVLVDEEELHTHAVMWQGAGKTVLGTLGETWSQATAINESGQVVGIYDSSSDGFPVVRGFLWEDGAMVDVGVDFGGEHIQVTDISDAGDIVGGSSTASGPMHAFLKRADGTVIDIGTIGEINARANAINNAGQVVGSAGVTAFIWENGVMTDLNDLVDPEAGWALQSAEDINDAGQIVGYGIVDGQTRAFLLTPKQPPWTLMFYLDGDNDLAATYPPIFNQLELAADNPHVNVLVLWDSPEFGDTAYIEVQHDTDLSNSADYVEGENYWDQGELDMAYFTTLTDFVTWAMSNYPAEHYALFLTDHGSGLGGGLVDDGQGGGQMYLDDMQQAFLDAPTLVGQPLDVLYMDMCLMGMVEVAYEVGDYANYMVASQHLQWAVSAPYFSYIDGIEADTGPAELAALFAGAYAAANATFGDPFTIGSPYTISAVDVGQLDAVVAAADALALALQDNMAEIAFTLGEVADQVQRYDVNNDGAANTGDSYADLFHLAQLVEQEMAAYPEIVAEAQALQAALQSYVIAEHHGNSGAIDLENSHGVSIFFPTNASSYYDGFNNDFAAGTDWGSLVPAAPDQEGVAWGPMLVDYIQVVNPGGPDTSEPPAPVGRLVPQGGAVYLPMVVQ